MKKREEYLMISRSYYIGRRENAEDVTITPKLTRSVFDDSVSHPDARVSDIFDISRHKEQPKSLPTNNEHQKNIALPSPNNHNNELLRARAQDMPVEVKSVVEDTKIETEDQEPTKEEERVQNIPWFSTKWKIGLLFLSCYILFLTGLFLCFNKDTHKLEKDEEFSFVVKEQLHRISNYMS